MDNIHKGHRSRMREKLVRVGEGAFNTYELLEMMLYYVIPYKDTNPISQRLFMRFGSLDGIFSASVEELCEVDGVGEATAQYIKRLSKFCEDITSEEKGKARTPFTREGVCEYARELLSKGKGSFVYLLLFDSGMHLISSECISDSDLGSAAVKPTDFVRAAATTNATGAVIAHSHPYGPLFMSEADRMTVSLIKKSLAEIGVTLLMQIIVSGERYKDFDC